MTGDERELLGQLNEMTRGEYDRWCHTSRPFNPNVNVAKVMLASKHSLTHAERLDRAANG